MKPHFLAPACLAATLFVLPVRAWADSGSGQSVIAAPSPAPKPALSAADAEILKRYDKNGDGKLDDAEVAAAMDENRRNADAGREQKLDRLKERQQVWLKEFDKNGDGKLDAAERATMEQTLRARLERSPRMLKRADTDGDGKLSDAEWAAVKEKILARFEKKEAK
ncbi:MAG TPA: EF-hand domain-containing protein [Rariglobus sp.]|jgi:Ca2+-binding EF-hand superfamily protein|nr:EF-hand domain-containing protein [Rariglobus sp.]